ncbi:MAG: AraC family transcriptional regulator [Bacteroidales bacterium]
MDPILYIGISQAFFAGLLIATKRPRIMANRVLAAWFFLICIEMIIVLINSNLVELYSIKVLPFTYGPLMFLYARMMTREKPTFDNRFLLHFVPFLVFFTVSMIFLDKPVMEGTKGFLITDRFISLRLIYGISFFISITAYSIATFLVIHRHQKNLKSILSYSSAKYTLQWLIGLSVTFYLSYVLMFVVGLMDILLNFMPFDPFQISFLGLTVFAFLFGYYGVKQPWIFEEIAGAKVPPLIVVKTKNKKYSRSGLKSRDVEMIRKAILEHMENNKPYLNRELSISDLAADIQISRHFITEVINNHMGKNFYLLINEYRIEEVKRRLHDPKYKNLTILAIAYDSGFNSKSAFNTVFRQMTGKTPSQYLKG